MTSFSYFLRSLLRKYEKEVTPQKKGRDKEKYRLRILQKSTLSGVSLSKLKPHHITKFRVERLRVVSAGTVLKDLGLLSSSLGFTLILLTSSRLRASPV